ncbi:MAG: prepilin-type N-terminal cleavage/methylation domain-containing protein [Candidatus Azambacteria bacterium]|nr:prepilin-type N-terminal cleavage/methylation domain-containing protein [Candidatus Azambacteria bacterium]
MLKIKKEKRSALNLSKGFTLLELLVVIGIIGLLASILVVNLSSARRRARDTKRVSDVRAMQTAVEDYYGKNAFYPTSIGALVTGNFLPLRPTDPLAPSVCANAAANSNDCYFYAYYPASNPYSYHLGSSLEEMGSLLLNQDRDCVSTSGSGCPYTSAYTSGFNGADATGCSGTVNRACYDAAQ